MAVNLHVLNETKLCEMTLTDASLLEKCNNYHLLESQSFPCMFIVHTRRQGWNNDLLTWRFLMTGHSLNQTGPINFVYRKIVAPVYSVCGHNWRVLKHIVVNEWMCTTGLCDSVCSFALVNIMWYSTESGWKSHHITFILLGFFIFIFIKECFLQICSYLWLVCGRKGSSAEVWCTWWMPWITGIQAVIFLWCFKFVIVLSQWTGCNCCFAR